MGPGEITAAMPPNSGARPARVERPTWAKLKFAAAWLATGNNKLAALRCGIPEKRAGDYGRRLTCDPYVRRMIREGMAKRLEIARVDAGFVLTELVRLYRATSIAQLLAVAKDGEDGDYRFQHRFDLTGAPPEVLHAVQEMRIGDDGAVTIRMPDRLKLLELIGKHVDVSAWEDKVQVELRNAEDIVSRIQEGRQRVAERARLAAIDGEVVEHGDTG